MAFLAPFGFALPVSVAAWIPVAKPAHHPAETYILTVRLDDASFGRLQDWRMRHFPPERNYLPAHLTLFHTLSVEQIARLRLLRSTLENLQPASVEVHRPATSWPGRRR
jgi:2'-5' RNA ligase superfamily protein